MSPRAPMLLGSGTERADFVSVAELFGHLASVCNTNPGAASKDNGATHAHFEAMLVHSEATPVHSKAMYPHSEVIHSRSEVIHSRSKAIHGRPEVTHSRSEAIHGHSKAMHSCSEVTHSYSGAVHAEATHAHLEVTPDHSKAMRTRSKAAHTHSKTTPSHREGYQGTHSGSAGTASNGHHATPAHANNRQVSGPIASFPHLCASIMIHDAYPDATLIRTFVLRAFLAATSNNLRAVYVHQCIRQDHVYLSKMTVLPQARITVFHAEVKERCVAAVALLINPNDFPTSIVDLIDKQLNDNYNYIFPRRSNHQELFPTHPGVNGTVAYEIPKSMLALVSTVYYAALHEWSSGKRQQQNFTADGSADVYRSHLTSLNNQALAKLPFQSHHWILAHLRWMNEPVQPVSPSVLASLYPRLYPRTCPQSF
ncbi:hypothetical protein EDB86DRAFT_3242614 [Lactarius hatsudake]|nr:hypothetical protein EDB86DRAFT_3242614 [Lactarius hatsudake]